MSRTIRYDDATALRARPARTERLRAWFMIRRSAAILALETLDDDDHAPINALRATRELGVAFARDDNGNVDAWHALAPFWPCIAACIWALGVVVTCCAMRAAPSAGASRFGQGHR